MKHIGDLWGSLRGILRNHPTFAQIKDLVGAAGLPVQELAHLQQKHSNGPSKGQLMDEIDGLVKRLDDNQRDKFVATCTKELLKRYSNLHNEVKNAFVQHGWDINDAQEIVSLASDDFQILEEIKLPHKARPKTRKTPLFKLLEWYHKLNIRERIVVAIIAFFGTCILAASYIIAAYIQSHARQSNQVNVTKTEGSHTILEHSRVSGDVVGRDKIIVQMPVISKPEDVVVSKTGESINIEYPKKIVSTTITNKQIAKIHFEQSRLFVNRAIWGNDQIPVYFFKVQILNESEDSSIHAKYLKLTDLRKLNSKDVFVPWENAVPAILEWPIDISKDISPKENVFVPFTRIFPPEIQKMRDTLLSGDIEVPQLRFTVAIWDRQMTSHIPPGTHRFKITAYFENNPPAEAEFQLEWSGEQRENLDSMVKDIRIKQIY